MLIQYKRQCFLLMLIYAILYYAGNLFCAVSDIQKNKLNHKYSNRFYHLGYVKNKTTNNKYYEPVSNTEKKQPVNSLGYGEQEPWSNAFNFNKVWGTTVDPRTGILSAYVKTGSMLSNLGHGPDINLEINYSSSALANPDGLGRGWSWNLTHFNPFTHQLTTSFGQNFYLKKQFNGHWLPLYHKLRDMFIQGDASTHFVITYANGLRETLNHEGYEMCLEQQDGWSVHFSYVPGTHLLQWIRDDEGHIIKLRRTNNAVSVISRGSTGQPVEILIYKKNSEVHSITLPSFNDHTYHGIYFHYIQHFMTGVDYPTGLTSRITYNCSDEIKVSAYNTAAPHALCAVIEETADPGFGQPVMITRFQYGKININEHNYLGFNSGLNITDSASKDLLFEAPVSYTYQTEQDNGLIQEIRTYNKYHLMTDEQQINYRTGHILSAVHYYFCRTDQPDGCANSSFADLPATYSLPLKVITRVWGDAADKPAVTTTTMHYDSQGRVIRQTDVYKRITVNHYCPLNGDVACPAVSKEWPFSALVESTTLYPDDTKTSTDPPLPVTTYNYYQKKINHNGKGYISVLYRQKVKSGNQQLTTTRYYYNNPQDLLTYGLLKRAILTGQQNKADSSDAVSKNYYYIKSPDSYTKTMYSTIELSESKCIVSYYVTTSLFTNQVLMITDAEKKDSDIYYYDPWDRLIKTERSAGTDFAASIHYDYTTFKNLNQILITAVNGFQEKTIFDSTGRVLESFTEVVDKTGKQQPDRWWPVQKNYYDQYGRIVRQSSYIIGESGMAKALNTISDYDDTGRVVRVHLPDGEMTVMRYDDSDRCVISYHKNRQGKRSVISVSKANILSKPIKQWILPATNYPLPSTRSLCINTDKRPEARVSVITYDGFGRQITAQDPAGRIVKQHYDPLGRLTDTIDPVGNQVHAVYNLTRQVIQSWVYPVSGGHYLLSSSDYNKAGQLIWHAGEDGKRTVYTYTVDGQVATVTTPNRYIFSWQYNLLNLPVSQSINNKEQWSICYNPVTLSVQRKIDITGTKIYFYRDDGLIKRLIFTGKNSYSDYKLQWKYDNNQRVISTTDISDNKINTQYDWLGRVARVTYQSYQSNHTEMLSVPTYDDFSRIKYIDYGSGMHRVLHYDSLGREDQIADTQRKQLISQWKMTYDISSNIIMLNQTTGNQQSGILHYQYDVLDNLVSMQCQGSSGLPLCPHDTSLTGSKLLQAPVIIHQDYTFTPLNRLSSVREILQPTQQQQTISKVTSYHYGDVSVPLRLQSISTAWSQSKPVIHYFTHDDIGNMTVDGQNNHITYNALNEVTQVISSTGKQSNYSYDSSGQEMMEQSLKGVSYLFYRGGTLINEKITSLGQDTHINGYLGMAKTTDGMVSEYYENSYKGDISGIFRKNNNQQYSLQQRNIYSPYGMVWHKTTKSLPLYQQTLQEFNGERTGPATGWQFLGNGNRTYNSTQRYFLSEDPAGDGYAFGSNNPIMNTDPSGNSPRWLGEIFKWTGYVSTMGLSALHQRWANITAAVIQAGCTVATLGAAAAGAGFAVLAGVVAGTAAIGSIPVVAAVIPANKGLNVAGNIIGVAEMAVSIAAGIGGLLPFAVTSESEEVFGCEIPKMLPSGAKNLEESEENISATASGSSASMSVQSKLIPPLIYVPTTAQAVFESSFRLFYDKLSKQLILYSLQNVVDTWASLRNSVFHENIKCDTGCILLAYYVARRNLYIENLDKFLSVREKYLDYSGSFSSDHEYIEALAKILNHVRFKGSRGNKDPVYNVGDYNSKALSQIFCTHQYALIQGRDHMIMLEKIPPYFSRGTKIVWRAYQFYADSDNLNISGITTRDLATKILKNSSSGNKLSFIGYLGII